MARKQRRTDNSDYFRPEFVWDSEAEMYPRNAGDGNPTESRHWKRKKSKKTGSRRTPRGRNTGQPWAAR